MSKKYLIEVGYYIKSSYIKKTIEANELSRLKNRTRREVTQLLFREKAAFTMDNPVRIIINEDMPENKKRDEVSNIRRFVRKLIGIK